MIMEGMSEEHNFLLQAGDTKAIQQGQLSSFLEGLLEKISLCVKTRADPLLPKILPNLFHFQHIICHSTGWRRQRLSLSLREFHVYFCG